jgi:phosphogluconate dehydratase
MSKLHATLETVTARIVEKSKQGRAAYLDLIARQRDAGVNRPTLSCGNLAHGFAASGEDKTAIRGGKAMNIGQRV